MLQRALIRYLLEPLASFMERIPVTVKEITFRICCAGIFLMYCIRGGGFLKWRYLYFFTVCCLFLGIMILTTLKRGMVPIRGRKGMIITWFGTGICMLISGITKTVDYLPEASLFLLGFPIAFFVWKNYGFEKVINLLLDGILLSFAVFMVVSMLFYPMETTRYQSFFLNINATAFFLIVPFVAALARVLQYAKSDWKRCAGYSIVLGIVFATTFYTASRTGQIAVIACLLLSLIGYFCLNIRRNFLACCRCFALIAVSIALLFNTTLYLFQIEALLQKVPPSLEAPSQTETEPSPTDDAQTEPGQNSGQSEQKPGQSGQKPGQSGQKPGQSEQKPTQSAPEPTQPEQEPTEPPKPEITFEQVLDRMLSRLRIRGKTLDEISSGRITVWKECIKQWSWFGHGEPFGVHVYINTKYQYLDATIDTPHSGILQVYYNNGFLAAILYLSYVITSLFASIRFAFKNKDSAVAIVPFAFTIAFLAFAVVTSVTPSFLTMPTLFYHFMQFCLWEKPAKRESLPS